MEGEGMVIRKRLRYCVCGHDWTQHLWPDETADKTENPHAVRFQLRHCRLCSCPAFVPATSPSDIRLAKRLLPKLYPEKFGPLDREAVWKWQMLRRHGRIPKLFVKRF